jgi:hypothetical protein
MIILVAFALFYLYMFYGLSHRPSGVPVVYEHYVVIDWVQLLTAAIYLCLGARAWYLWCKARRFGWRLTVGDLLWQAWRMLWIKRVIGRGEAELLPGFDSNNSDFRNLIVVYKNQASK